LRSKAAASIASALVAALICSASASAVPRHLAAGAKLGTIRISKIGLSSKVYQGGADFSTNPWPSELNKGPGHYPDTPLPWEPGTVALAGHRVTHTHPFRKVNLLHRGNPIVLKTRWGVYHYHVVKVRIVSPDSTWILDWGGPRGHRLVLTACNPPGSDYQRIVVFAKLAQYQKR
jgi:sortase A